MLGQEERLEEMVVAFSEFFSIGPINKLHMNEGATSKTGMVSKQLKCL